jgi:hypothetical protein
MVEEEREATAAPRPVQSSGPAPVPKQSSGPAPGGDEEFGDAPKPDESFGDAPTPPGSNRNVSLLVGGLIAVVVLIAVVLGFAVR